jgi:hypothetical protein
MVVKRTPSYSQYLSVIDILWPKFVDNIKLGVFYLTGREKGNSLHCLFKLETQLSRIWPILKEVSETLNVFNLKQAQPLEGFDPEGLFSEHLASMRYNNLFTRVDEETSDNDSTKKDKNVCNEDLTMEISSNTQSQRKTRQRGKVNTNVQSSSNPQPHKSSSSGKRRQEYNVNKEESNEGCVGGDRWRETTPCQS